MRASILAGGFGTRISNYYPDIPKSIIPINGVPFIYRQLDLLFKNNFTEVIICLGYRSEQIIDCVKDFNFVGMKISFSDDGEKSLGTGGAIKKIMREHTGDVFVIYGDSYLDFHYQKAINTFYKNGNPMLMTLYHNKNKIEPSNVFIKNKKIFSYSKSNPDSRAEHIDYGASIFSEYAFENTPEIFDLSEIQSKLIKEKKASYYISENRFYQIGTIDGIKELEERIINNV